MKKFIQMRYDCDLVITVLVNFIEKIDNDTNIEIIASASDIDAIRNDFNNYINYVNMIKEDLYESIENKKIKITYTTCEHCDDRWVFISDNYIYISNGA